MSGFKIVDAAGIMPLPAAMLAQVSDVEMAKRYYQAGEGLFQRGDYRGALAEFRKSYGMSKKPELHYNIAQCYEKLMRPEEALAAYRLYLANDPYAPDYKKVEVRIAALEDLIKERKGRGAPPPAKAPGPPPPGPEPAPEPKRAPPPEPASVPPARPEDAEVEEEGDVYIPPPDGGERPDGGAGASPGGAPYRALMWTSLALSVVAAAAGGVSYYHAGKKEDEYAGQIDDLKREGAITGSADNYRFASEDAREFHAGKMDGLKEDGDRFDTLSTVGFAGGAAFLGLAGLFFWLDRGEAAVAVGPGAGGGEASLRWSF